MRVILKESFRCFIVQGSAIILATIIFCYVLAVSLGHVPIWLPMISDCGVYAPEKYFFCGGLITGSVFVFAESILLYHAEGKAFSNSRLSLILTLVASLGMGVVGAVNEKENLVVHTVAALVAFGCYLAFMAVMVFFSRAEPTISPISMAIKKGCTIIGVIAVVTPIILHLLGIIHFKFVIGKIPPIIALCEWVIMSSIMVFNISFYLDVHGILLCEVNENLNKQK